MKSCSKCNSKISILSRVKALNREDGEIECDNCKTRYKRKYNLLITIINALFISTAVSLWDFFSQDMFIIKIIGSMISYFIVYIIIFLTASYLMEYEEV